MSAKTAFKILQSTAETTRNGMQPFEMIPGPKPLPVIGNVWRYLPIVGDYKPNALFENAKFNREHYGPIVREQLTENLTILHLFDPDDVESLFRQDGKYPCRRSHRALLKYRRDRPGQYLDGGLFPENGQNWYRQRNQFQQHLMSKSRVSANVSKLDSSAKSLIKQISACSGGQDTFTISNFDSILYRWALGNSLSLFLDIDIDEQECSTTARLVEELHNSLRAVDKTEIETDKWIKRPEKCPFYNLLVQSQDFLFSFVAEKVERKSRKVDCDTTSSYINHWLHVDKMDKRDIISFIIDALMAGLHTTSYSTAFLLYHLSRDKNLQNELRAQVDKNLPHEDRVRASHVDQLILLRDCLKESLRLNPVSIGTGRLISSDEVAIRGYQIPRGTMVITQNQVISRDSKVFTQPEMFRPCRWSEFRSHRKQDRPSPFATLPFGFGTRSCIGRPITELQVKLMVARLLQRYQIDLVPEIPIKTTLIHNLDGHFAISLRKI